MSSRRKDRARHTAPIKRPWILKIKINIDTDIHDMINRRTHSSQSCEAFSLTRAEYLADGTYHVSLAGFEIRAGRIAVSR